MPRSIPRASSSLVQMTSLVPPNCWNSKRRGVPGGLDQYAGAVSDVFPEVHMVSSRGDGLEGST